MSRDLEVQVADSEAQGATVRIVHDYVPDDHVAMALVRAVNAACVQLGITPPGVLFAQAAAPAPAPGTYAAAGTEADPDGEKWADTATGKRGFIDYEARAQMNMINNALTRMGYEHNGGPLAVLDVVMQLESHARVARALGPDFAYTLKVARERYQVARLVGDHLDQVGVDAVKTADISSLLRAVVTLGDLLFQMRGIEPEPVDNGNGTTTHTLTEAVEIGTPEVSP